MEDVKIEDPKIKTKVEHSQSKTAWNVIGTSLGGKYKVARIPYLMCDSYATSKNNRIEALKHAKFISHCFNNSKEIKTFVLDVVHKQGKPKNKYE